jgi:hypothetical protein
MENNLILMFAKMKISPETKKSLYPILFSAFIGSPIGYFFQWKYHVYENNLNIMQEERKVSVDFLMTVSTLMDERIYEMDKCYKSLKNSNSEEEINQRWEDYKVSLNKWNGTLSKNLALAEFYFSKDLSDKFAATHKSFLLLGRKLDSAKRNNIRGNDLVKMTKDFDIINQQMSEFLKNGLSEIYARGK